MSFRLYVWQRATAVVLVPMILIHLIVIFYATAKGISAAGILGRTRGSIAWGVFYSAFVVAASIHGAIGIRNVLAEWGPQSLKRNDGLLGVVTAGVGVVLVLLGLRAVYAVVMP
jgi:fumarate reductase subunit C